MSSGDTAWMLTATVLVLFTALWLVLVYATVIIVVICKATAGLPISKEDEITGLDQAEHGETAYHWE